jgi:ribA/ribD-fused uncharacterized protein
MLMIIEFQGKYRFLSNFWICDVPYDGLTYPSSEHAYQAAKLPKQDRPYLAKGPLQLAKYAKPGTAKRLGGAARLDSDWEGRKIGVMRDILRSKFTYNTDLRDKLLETSPQELQEGNRWGDEFWGVDLRYGYGENHLGKLLMELRDESQRTTGRTEA